MTKDKVETCLTCSYCRVGSVDVCIKSTYTTPGCVLSPEVEVCNYNRYPRLIIDKAIYRKMCKNYLDRERKI